MAVPRITPGTIEAARREFLRLDRHGAALEPVVIARDVTIAELCTARREWFDRVRVALLTDGSLVVTDVGNAVARRARTNIYNAVAAELQRQLGAYARVHGLVSLPLRLTFSADLGDPVDDDQEDEDA